MKRLLTLLLLMTVYTASAQYDHAATHTKSLDRVLREISERFSTRLRVQVDTVGLVVPHADSYIRPYSLEESLENVLQLFRYKYVKQSARVYKIKPYEPHYRTPEEGRKHIDYLTATYHATKADSERRMAELREVIGGHITARCDALTALMVEGAELEVGKRRSFEGYTVENFSIETLPGLYLCGSIYRPAKKLKRGEKFPLILSPDGHTTRYIAETQLRLATWARMGAVAVGFDLVGYGESELQLGAKTHHSLLAQELQWANCRLLLDKMLAMKEIDPTRVGLCGASGGGTQTMQMGLDSRFTATCPVISLSSYFDGGCPCESAFLLPTLAESCNAELAAALAPRPLGVVSDGKDWTAHVPEIEGPFLRAIYRLHGKESALRFYHYPDEGHDFGVNKRTAVYDFFAACFGLDKGQIDEEKVSIESPEALKLFGAEGEKLPANAVRSIEELPRYAAERAVSLR